MKVEIGYGHLYRREENLGYDNNKYINNQTLTT
jgi:hypothetical protein